MGYLAGKINGLVVLALSFSRRKFVREVSVWSRKEHPQVYLVC